MERAGGAIAGLWGLIPSTPERWIMASPLSSRCAARSRRSLRFLQRGQRRFQSKSSEKKWTLSHYLARDHRMLFSAGGSEDAGSVVKHGSKREKDRG